MFCAGLAAARSAAIAGFLDTSNVAAAKAFDLAPVDSMAHAYVTAFASEVEAFARTFPENTKIMA